MNQTKQKPAPLPANSGPDFFENLGNRAYLFTLTLLMAVAFFVFQDFLLFKNVFLYKDIGSDTLNGVYPYFRHLASYFKEHGMPTWSFAEGMGQSIMAGFLRDPFQLPAILAGPESMPKIFIYVEVFKIILGGSVFYFFLKSLKVSNYSATLGALLFSFSGFMIIGACWYLFTFEAFNLALLLLGFEKIYQKKQWGIFILAVFITGISFPVNLFPFGLFILFYSLFRFLQDQKFNGGRFLNLLTQLVLAGIIGVLLSGPFLLENIFQVLESPRGSGTDSYFALLSSSPKFALVSKYEFGSSVMRMFSSDILGSGNSFSGFQNYLESPLGYCGLISLMLFTQVFTQLEKSKRRVYIGLFVLWLIPTLFPYFRYAFWLFSGDYYRIYSFFLALVLILFSVQALDLILKSKKVNLIALIGTLGFWLLLTSIHYKSPITYPGSQAMVKELIRDETITFFVRSFLLFYALVIYFLVKSKNQVLVKTLLLVLVGIELIYLSSISVSKRDIVSGRELKEKTGYNDYSMEAVKYMKSREKGFFRVDKMYFSGGAMHGSLNDHKVQDYYGTSSYNSFAQINFVKYMRGYDVIDKYSEYASRWVDGLRNRPFLEPLNHVKYVLTKNASINPLWKNTHDSVAKFGDVVVLKHKFELPIGYTYEAFMPRSEFDRLSPTQKDLMSYKAVIIEDEDLQKTGTLKRIGLNDSIDFRTFTWDYLPNKIQDLKQESLQLSVFEQDRIEGKIKLSKEKLAYFSFPYDKGWKAYIDGKETEKLLVSCGMTGLVIPAGEHSIELVYHLRFYGKGWILFALGLALGGGLYFFNRKKQLKASTHG
ncbi:MAG: YfhO family protein [Bacteroidia bacterium]|nr:YfhO family protein [Bacteroidia bacterium]